MMFMMKLFINVTFTNGFMANTIINAAKPLIVAVKFQGFWVC